METQVQKYEEIRKLFSNPEKAILYSDKYNKEKAFFIGIVIFTPPKINKKILGVIEKLKNYAPNNLFVQEDFLHVTFQEIAFLPEKFNESIYDDYIKRINLAIKKIEPFKLKIRGVNHFPNVLFAQVFSKDNKLYEYHKILEKTFPEHKSKFDYVPHVTMAQFLENPEKLFGAINNFNNTNLGEMLVNKIALVKCDLPSKGEKFEIIKIFELAKK
jgi:2'-5' RNA ligase